MTDLKNFSNKDLLIRIDERQHTIMKELEKACRAIDEKVDMTDFAPYKKKTDALWDNQNKAIGWVIAGATGGGLAELVKLLVTNVFAAF